MYPDLTAAQIKTLADLEWSRIVLAVRARCLGPLRDLLTELALPSELPVMQRAMGETAELLRLRKEGDGPPLSGIQPVRGALARVEKGGALDGPTLDAIRSTLGAARALRLYLARRKADAPLLREACALDPTLDGLEEDLAHAIEPGGAVSDRASPELRRLRSEVATLRARIVARLEALMLQHESIVQDRFVTLREGRYVMPVRTDAHDKLPGIVHATSGSGATVFIEPHALVEQQNRLTIAISEMEAEEQRILAALSVRVGERGPETVAALDGLDRADLRHACAKLGEDLKATVPTLSAEARFDVRDARHPILLLDGVDVVPNDLMLSAGQGLVISGPNAGGKTVALKCLGTFALMARAGVPIPAQEGAIVGAFDSVLSDVGDEQSMSKNLSTFSAHIKSVVAMLDEAGPRSLVLLDEVATGTDPHEGAALAAAIVEGLLERGAAVAVTTHYESLKALALSDDRLRNASVGLDVERLAPTFELRWDVPGASSALTVASRFGLEAKVTERARGLLSGESRQFEELVLALEGQHHALKSERAELEQLLLAARRDREGVERDRQRLKAQSERRVSEEAEKLITMLKELRAEVKDARAKLRSAPTADQLLLDAARAAVDRAQSKLEGDELSSALRPPVPEAKGAIPSGAELAVGKKVFVPHLKAEAEIVEGLDDKQRLRVQSGAMKLWVDLDRLRRIEPKAKERERKESEEAPAGPPPTLLRTESNSLDLRGMRVDDALSLLDTFLDRMVGQNEPAGFVMHGVGTGALRDAVRVRLKEQTRWVKRFRPGATEEGGDRITVVLLA
jgi:DNA mismatch repair protein MutS2